MFARIRLNIEHPHHNRDHHDINDTIIIITSMTRAQYSVAVIGSGVKDEGRKATRASAAT